MTPAVPRPSATVVLTRTGGSGRAEVFVMHRATTMAFAPGATVFPGGGHEPADPDLRHTAIRETFEETSVLLVEGDGAAIAAARAERAAVVAGRVTLSELFERHRLTPLELEEFLHLITPEDRPIRYDTRFFVVALPAGQTADTDTREAVGGGWDAPAALLARGRAGELALMRPTRAALTMLAERLDSLDD